MHGVINLGIVCHLAYRHSYRERTVFCREVLGMKGLRVTDLELLGGLLRCFVCTTLSSYRWADCGPGNLTVCLITQFLAGSGKLLLQSTKGRPSISSAHIWQSHVSVGTVAKPGHVCWVAGSVEILTGCRVARHVPGIVLLPGYMLDRLDGFFHVIYFSILAYNE